MMPAVKDYFLNVNLFKPLTDSGEREDEQQHRLNLVATRVYLVVLTLSLLILALVTWLNPQITIITLQYPTKEQFKLVPFDAQCSCSRVSISYNEFTPLEASFHQVCTSDFVSDRWIKSVFFYSNTTYFNLYDLRISASALFRALAGFCRLAQGNVLQTINSFAMSTLLSPQLLAETIFRSQAQASIDQFQSAAANTFGVQLELLRQITTASRLL